MSMGNSIQDGHGKSNSQQKAEVEEGDSSHQQIGLKFREGTSNMLHLEHIVLKCGHLRK
jgi:hypothetical protein